MVDSCFDMVGVVRYNEAMLTKTEVGYPTGDAAYVIARVFKSNYGLAWNLLGTVPREHKWEVLTRANALVGAENGFTPNLIL